MVVLRSNLACHIPNPHNNQAYSTSQSLHMPNKTPKPGGIELQSPNLECTNET